MSKLSLPEDIKNNLSKKSQEGLVFFLNSNILPMHKYCWSNSGEGDIGTPKTVDSILTQEKYIGTNGFEDKVLSQVKLNEFPYFRWGAIIGYLTGTDWINGKINIADKDGINQLEGELKRFWARKLGAPDAKLIKIFNPSIRIYCRENRLGMDADYYLINKLNNNS